MIPRVVASSDDRGQILLLTALSMVVILGVAALSLDASFMYDKRNRLYAAADGAAKSGAIEVYRVYPTGVPQASLEAFADREVAAHGFVPTRLGGTTTVTVYNPPVSGSHIGDAGYVEVITSEPTPTFIGTVLGLLSMTPTARAVAGTSAGANCLITLGPPGISPPSLHIGASSNLTMPGCGVSVGGDLDMQSSAYINSAFTGVVGDCTDTGGGCTHVSNMDTSAPPPTDPLAAKLTPPADPGGCTSPTLPGGGTAYTMSPGCYNAVLGGATGVNLTMLPGTYYIKGTFHLGNNALVNGSGILIFLAGTAPPGPCAVGATAGCMYIENNATMNLSAQTSGMYSGVLFYQEPSNRTDASFTGNNPAYNFSGALYFPTAHVDFRNGLSGTNDCTLILAYTLDIDHGVGTFTNTCSGYGGSPLLTVTLAE